MSKLFLALFLFGVLLVISDARPRGRWRNRGLRNWGSNWRRYLSDDIGRGFRNWMRRHRFHFGLGPREDRWFDLSFDFGGDRSWWEGPNVCSSSVTADNRTRDISPHNQIYSKTCDDTETAYKCITTVITQRTEAKTTDIKECCAGYTRKSGDFGCPIEVNLKNVVRTARDLNLRKFIEAIESVNLATQLEQGNFTVFAPVDDAFKDLDTLIQPDTNIRLQDTGSLVVVSKPLTDILVSDLQNLLLGHVSFDYLTTSRLNDEQLVETGSPFKSKVRINFYGDSEKLMTANCKKVTSRDNIATNGVIHVVEQILEPVSESLLDIIIKDPQLSYLKTAIGRSGLGQTFREDGQFTVFAPTDNAFRKIDQSLLNKLLAGDDCLTKVLKNHVLPNVICSAVIQGRKTTPNLLNKHLQLERDENDKMFVERVQIVKSDVMATNGVLYLIDEVILPDEALNVLDIATKENATQVLNLIQAAGLEKTLREAENITLFAPTDEAFSKLEESIRTELENNPVALQDVLKYHVSPSIQSCKNFYNNYQIGTLYGDKKIRINEYSSFPWGRMWSRTAQCSPISKATIKGCNGVVHLIDKVMMPPKGNVVDVLESDSRFTKLVELVKRTGLADVLQQDGPYTIFAPTNQAFENVDEDIMNNLLSDEEELTSVLKSHVIRDVVCCAGFENEPFHGRSLKMLSGERQRIGRENDIPIVARKEIKECDLSATNGVVHVIDDVIIPRRMNHHRRWNDFWDDFDFDWDF